MLIKTNQMARNELSPTSPYHYPFPTHFTVPTFRPITVPPSKTSNRQLAYIAVVVPIVILLTLARIAHRRRQRLFLKMTCLAKNEFVPYFTDTVYVHQHNKIAGKRIIKKVVESVVRSRPDLYVIGGPPTGSSHYPPSGPTPYPPAGPRPYRPAHSAPYPPAAGDYSSNPPPYNVAVSKPPIQPPPTKEGYGKQAPYNSHYN